MNKPNVNEYAPYYQRYIDMVDEKNVFSEYKNLSEEIITTLENISEEKGNYRYAEGKWSIKEVLAHILHSERIFGYRALAISLGEKSPLPGYAQNDYVANGKYDNRSLKSLLNEYKNLSEANLELFQSFSNEMLLQMGNASGKDATVRGLVFITVGHEKHHWEVIKSKYL